MSYDPFIATRTFETELKTLWAASTQAGHLSKWWGPVGFDLTVYECDVKAGGRLHYGMKKGEVEMFGLFQYTNVIDLQVLEMRTGFANAEGEFIRAPFSELFPIQVTGSWTFSEENGKSTIRIESIPFQANAEEEAFFFNMHDSMRQGYGSTNDQLEAYLKTL
jgi:uncharacterized protein YndB with AHSA1/START domain